MTGVRPVRLADELDDLVSRTVRQDGDDTDRGEVWELIAQWAVHMRAHEARFPVPVVPETGTDRP